VGDLREYAPLTRRTLWLWVRSYTGIEIASHHVCPHHTPPWKVFTELLMDRPALALVLGARGAGKSFLSALHTHLNSRWNPRHETRILGGSQAQSLQVYKALCELVRDGSGNVRGDEVALRSLLKCEARYWNGSEVAILAASPTSVRGPHVPSLKLDEVDEIDPECREAAMGMCMARRGASASALMTSTWHRVDGPMANLMDQARAGSFPLYTFCSFEVLERCPEERSGPLLENCGACPLKPYCHAVTDGGPPLAKRSRGHYAIESLVQKMKATSVRSFEAEYLCLGPRTDGLWFPGFTPLTHVSERAEFDPAWPVHLAVDSGVFTGAVFFQVVKVEGEDEVRIFADHLAENLTAESNARALLELARSRCLGRLDRISTDPAGGSRNPVGPTVIAEYERVGLRPMQRWPLGSVSDGLALIESFVNPADGRSRLWVHPRCQATIRAFSAYRRARRGGQWQDYPEDPQHPQEDLLDALRGGLRTRYPEGRTGGGQPEGRRLPAHRVF
jgi:hypothetical protein